MSTKHTPGPWLWDFNAFHNRYSINIEYKGFTKEIAIVATGYNEPWESQQHANARLISAAPELLLALQMMVSALPKNLDWLDPDVERLAKQAIAHAAGETP